MEPTVPLMTAAEAITERQFREGKRFPHIVLVRVQGLLPMQYKAKELAEELGIPSRTLITQKKITAAARRFFHWAKTMGYKGYCPDPSGLDRHVAPGSLKPPIQRAHLHIS